MVRYKLTNMLWESFSMARPIIYFFSFSSNENARNFNYVSDYFVINLKQSCLYHMPFIWNTASLYGIVTAK